jgi:hypothetical protein
MHDGSAATLRDVIVLYNKGGGSSTNLVRETQPLHLSEVEVNALISLLENLTGPIVYLSAEALVAKDE